MVVKGMIMEYDIKDVHINNSEIPVKCKDTVDVHLTGGRYFFIAFAALMSMSALFGIGDALTEQNELKKQELEISRQKLELAKRQFTLDSLQYYNSPRKR